MSYIVTCAHQVITEIILELFMRQKIVFYFIFYCIKIRTNPRFFFQIHSDFFDEKQWIYSKYDLDKLIPEKWRLKSYKVTSADTIKSIEKNVWFPCILKPEWWQNAHGVRLITNSLDLKKSLHEIKDDEIGYIYQKYSDKKKEYELSFTKDHSWNIRVWSLVESVNTDDTGINSIHGKSIYTERIRDLSGKDLKTLELFIKKLQDFKIARIGIKADSLDMLLSWDLKIFEINIFIPLPLTLLAENVWKQEKSDFLKQYTKNMALLTKHREKRPYKEVFFRKIFLHYKIKLSQNPMFRSIKKGLYSFIENKFMNGCSDYNSLEVRRACRSKKQAREMFQKHNIPHAQGEVFINPYKAYTFVKKHWFPVVIKPNIWGYSRGSYFPIQNYTDLFKATFLAKVWWPSTVIETYLLWKNYRVVVTKDSVDIAMQRTPPTIIWDGEKYISDLIDEENAQRVAMKLPPIIHEIQKSKLIKKHLKKQWYNFSSILEKGKKIDLYHRVALAPGGVLYTVDTDTITEKNKKLFQMILDEFGANIFGIDVIMEQGIEYDFDTQKVIFLELNSRPYLKMHTVPRCGNPPDMKALYAKLDALEISWKWLF